MRFLPVVILSAISLLCACTARSEDETGHAGTTADALTEAAPDTITAGTASGVASGSYHCVFFVGYLQTTPGFTINDDGTYTHETGTGGTIAMDGDTVLFHDGALDAQAAKYEIDSDGRPTLRLYNESRSRTVIDCQKTS